MLKKTMISFNDFKFQQKLVSGKRCPGICEITDTELILTDKNSLLVG